MKQLIILGGYKSKDKNFKNTKELVHYLVKAAGNNANFLLNIGPRPDGTIQQEFAEHLHELGAWLRQNGQSIYETRGGPIAPMPWGVSTQKDNKIYLHVLKWENEPLSIPYVGKIIQANIWPSKLPVVLTKKGNGYVLQLSEDAIDEIDTIVALELAED